MAESPYKKGPLLGTGGFAEVWQVTRRSDARDVAMKILTSEDREDEERFRREVRVVGQLNHPNIIKIIDSELEVRPFWFVMPLYQMNLRSALKRHRGDEAWIREHFKLVLDAIEYAHVQNVVHRDLKPENILADGKQLIVADFGLAKNLTSDSMKITNSANALGTLEYCAPEQFDNSKAASRQADIFSLGKILYDMFVDRRICTGFAPDELPPALRPIFRKAVAPQPQQRYPSIADFRRELEEYFALTQDGGTPIDIESLSLQLDHSDISGKKTLVPKLLLALESYYANPSEYFKQVCSLRPSTLIAVGEVDRDAHRSMSARFSEYAVDPDRYWPFDKTDRVADAALRLFNASSDEEARAILIHCVFKLGVAYSRYYVMKAFGKMMSMARSNGEAICFYNQLKGQPPRDLRDVYDNLAEEDRTPRPPLDMLFAKRL